MRIVVASYFQLEVIKKWERDLLNHLKYKQLRRYLNELIEQLADWLEYIFAKLHNSGVILVNAPENMRYSQALKVSRAKTL